MEKDTSQNRRSGLNMPRNRCEAAGIDLQKRMALGSFSLFGEDRGHTASAVISLWNAGSVGCTNLRWGVPYYDAWWGYTPYPGASLGRSLVRQDQCKNTLAATLAADRDEK
jgi:hypothetical protein